MDLTDEQWDAIKAAFRARNGSGRARRAGGRGAIRATCSTAMMWILRTGAPWADLPRRYPPYQTCHRRFQKWVEDGVLERMLRATRAKTSAMRGKLDLTEAFIDGTHAGAKRGASDVGNHSTRQSDQGHGSGRPLWPSYRRRDCKWSAK